MTETQSPRQARQRALEALGAYQKRGTVSDDLSEIVEMLMDESDRGVVVILGSLLEDALLSRIEESFIPLTQTQRKNLIRSGGLLSNFDDRLNLAHALGLISESVVEELQVIKAMRNACAHSRLELTFVTPELRDALVLVFAGETAEAMRTTDEPLAIRIFFIALYLILLHEIKGAPREAAVSIGQTVIDVVTTHVKEAAAKHRSSLEKRKKRRAARPHEAPKGRAR